MPSIHARKEASAWRAFFKQCKGVTQRACTNNARHSIVLSTLSQLDNVAYSFIILLLILTRLSSHLFSKYSVRIVCQLGTIDTYYR